MAVNEWESVYFPQGQRIFFKMETKIFHDITGVKQNYVNGKFFTNQELRLSERIKEDFVIYDDETGKNYEQIDGVVEINHFLQKQH